MHNPSLFTWVTKRNFPDADFWITNRGTAKTVGQPIKEFQPYLTGIQCPALILPDYGYYLCVYFHSIGIWQQYAVGSLTYKNLRISDIRQVFYQISQQPANNMSKQITSHIHGRITHLAQKAINAGLVVQCDRTSNDTYLLRKAGEIAPNEYNPVAVGSILITLLNSIAPQ